MDLRTVQTKSKIWMGQLPLNKIYSAKRADIETGGEPTRWHKSKKWETYPSRASFDTC